jgi:adenylosuccinate synthase
MQLITDLLSQYLTLYWFYFQDYEGVDVEYITLNGWKTPICDVRKFEDLPEQAKNYVREIERLLGVPVWWIGVGQARDAIIVNKPE